MAKVLIVDDDRSIVRLLQTLLELDGFDVVTESEGSKAVAKVREQKPDVIVMDYHLKDIDGVEIVLALRADAQLARVPIVVTSGLDVESEVVKAGANAFLVKPFEPDHLSQLLRKLVGG